MSIVLDGTDGITTPSVTYEGDATINGLTVGRGAGDVSTNTALGVSALANNTTASNNTAVGHQAGYSNTTGEYNTLVGAGAGYSLTTGTGNTFVGSYYPAGYYVTTGSKNTVIGGYNGNQGGLDVRTSNNYIVLSDGDGNPRLHHNGTAWLNLAGRRSNAHTLGNCQEWVGSVNSIANGSSFSLFDIANIYDNLAYEIDVFINAGSFYAAKLEGVFGYTGTGSASSSGFTPAFVISRTGTTYLETMTITNTIGGTVNQYHICVRVWGYGVASGVSTGGNDLITSSYLTRIS